MKLAQIVPNSPLPSGSPARQAPYTTSPIAAGLQDLATSGNKVADLLARAEDEKRKHQQALDASRAVSTALDQLDAAETTLKMGERDATTGEVTIPPTSSQDFMPAWLKLRDKITQDALDRATTPESKLVVGKLLEAPFRERQHAARKFSNDLFVGQYTTGVEDEVASLTKRAILDPSTTPDGAPLWESRITGVLASAKGVLPPEKLRTLGEQATTHIDTARARRLGEADPEAAIEGLQTGKYRMPQDKADALATAIEAKWSARQRHADEQARRDDAAMVQSTKDNYTATVGALARDANRAQLSNAQLDDWARVLKMNRTDYDVLFGLVNNPPKPERSDPDALMGASIAINTDDLSMTPMRLAALRKSGRINEQDYERLAGRLESRVAFREGRELGAQQRALAAEGRAQTAENRATSAQHYEYSNALRYGKDQLGIPDMFPLDKDQQKLWSDFTEEFYLRTNPARGKQMESADAVVRELVPRFRVNMGEKGQRDIAALEARLRWQTEPELRAGALKYRLPEDQVRQQMDILAELAAKKKTLRDLEQSRAQEKGKAGGVNRAPAKPE